MTSLSSPNLPAWVTTPRPGQLRAASEALASFSGGTKVFFIDGPTGVGKTLIPTLVNNDMNLQMLYVASNHDLTAQYMRDFPGAVELKGRSNYPTELAPERFYGKGWDRVTCADCTRNKRSESCNWCSEKASCPYETAKELALRARNPVTNTAYWLTESNYVGRFGKFPLVVVDEGDLLESHLMGMVEVRIPKAMRNRLKIRPPKYVTVEGSWQKWMTDAVRKMQDWLDEADEDDKMVADVERVLGQALDVASDVGEGWAYTGDDESICFKPVEPAAWGPQKIWRHGGQFIVMSATLISAEVMAESLGLTEPWGACYLDSPFAPEKRPIRYLNAADMSMKNRSVAWPQLTHAIDKVLEYTPREDRVLVHTHSYALTNHVRSSLKTNRPVFAYMDRYERSDALEGYMQTEGAVLLAPSMERGIDLPGDLCRAQIICQLPYPYMGDRQVNKRVYGTGIRGKRWLLYETMRTVVQACGRGVRNEEDECVTWLMDSRMPSFVDRCRKEGFAPKWWLDGIEGGPWRKRLGLE